MARKKLTGEKLAEYRKKRAIYLEKWRAKNPNYNKEYYQKNREKIDERHRKWDETNKERVARNTKAYLERTKEKRAAARKIYVAENMWRWRIYVKNRRENIGEKKLSVDIVQKLQHAQKNKCACCRTDLRKVKVHLDHIEPISRGGSNDDFNVQLLCITCNLKKHCKDPIEFMQSQGYLI